MARTRFESWSPTGPRRTRPTVASAQLNSWIQFLLHESGQAANRFERAAIDLVIVDRKTEALLERREDRYHSHRIELGHVAEQRGAAIEPTSDRQIQRGPQDLDDLLFDVHECKGLHERGRHQRGSAAKGENRLFHRPRRIPHPSPGVARAAWPQSLRPRAWRAAVHTAPSSRSNTKGLLVATDDGEASRETIVPRWPDRRARNGGSRARRPTRPDAATPASPVPRCQRRPTRHRWPGCASA